MLRSNVALLRLFRSATLIFLLAPSATNPQPATVPVSCGDRCPLSSALAIIPPQEQVRLRPAPLDGNVERWFAFTTQNPSPGLENIRQIWLAENECNSLAGNRPLVSDPSGALSFHDPAWSADGRYLAYVQTNGTSSSIYVQEFQLATTIDQAAVKVGDPRLIVAGEPGVQHRRPDWRRDGLELAFDSNALGSLDLYTVPVDPGAPPPGPQPVRRTFADDKAEANPAYSPNGGRLAYTTNRFGPTVIEILNLETGQTTLAETDVIFVSHDNPRWSSDGGAVLYDAPEGENPLADRAIWCLSLSTQTKQQFPSPRAGSDADVDLSYRTNLTMNGSPFNYMVFSSGDPGLPCSFCSPRPSVSAWRGVTCCPVLRPLVTATVDLDPNTINLKSNVLWVTAYLELEGSDPASVDVATARLAGSVPAASKFSVIGDHDLDDVPDLMVKFPQATLKPLLSPGQNLLELTGSMMTGESFSGTDEIRVIDPPQSLPSATLAPNPLNPAGMLTIRTSVAGVLRARMFDLHGRLVRTLMGARVVPAGPHDIPIDGRGDGGEDLASGVYFYRIETPQGILTGRFAIVR